MKSAADMAMDSGHREAAGRAEEIFTARRTALWRKTDRMFACLMAGQWFMGIALSLWISPRTWAGAFSHTHIHVYAAVFLGGIIASLPVLLAMLRPGRSMTRHTIAVGQILTSALLIHLTGGRIETHFHVFGSLAFLAFYRDWRVLMTATSIVVLDHGVRGIFWPQSVYGIALIQPWRFVEHAAWVVFEDFFLIHSIRQSVQEMQDVAVQQAQLEEVNRMFERKVIERTQELTEANHQLDKKLEELRLANERAEDSRMAFLHAEKLAAVGQLAAGVAHEINNPIAVILGFAQSGVKRIHDDDPLHMPLMSIEREALRCKNLVQNLLALSRKGKLDGGQFQSFDLDEAIADTLSIIEAQARMQSVEFVKELGPSAAIWGDKEELQQVIVNLCNNAMDAMPNGGKIVVRTRSDGQRVLLQVGDTGSGIPKEMRDKIFNPFFTTKEVGKGTGLGLSLVHEIIQRHKGTIEFRSEAGRGTIFSISLPGNPAALGEGERLPRPAGHGGRASARGETSLPGLPGPCAPDPRA